MQDLSTLISVIAATVSAIGGTFAAVAAFRSAGSASDAHEASQTSEKRSSLRQLTITASEALNEARRASSRGQELKLSYRSLFTFSGSHGGSRETLYLNEVDKKLNELQQLSESVEPFAMLQENLLNGPVSEISIREIKAANILSKVRAIREDLERELASVDGQCATYREKVIQGMK